MPRPVPDLIAQVQDRLSAEAEVRNGRTVHVARAADVVAAVRLAGRHGTTVAVRGDGPWMAGPAPGLLIAPERLDEVSVSAGGWARVGAGVRWRRLLDAAAPHCLTPVTGARAEERVADSVTGGGVGPVARTYGLASDRVRAVELVTGDGVLRRVSPTEDPELFWAVRGGGDLGVVTVVELDLLAAGTVHAGVVGFAAADADRVLDAWRRWIMALPAQAGTSLVLTRAPATSPTVSVGFSWTGDPDDVRTVLGPLRTSARPVSDGVQPRRSGGVTAIPARPRFGVESSLLLDEFPAEAIPILLRLAAAPGPRSVELRLLGGAIAWLPRQPSAVCHRDARLAVRVIGGRKPPERAATYAGTEELAARVRRDTGGRAPAHGLGAAPDVLARTPLPDVRDRLAALALSTDPHRILYGSHRSGSEPSARARDRDAVAAARDRTHPSRTR
ncbi:FAD-binding oxidoreductase [Blastococcus sp. SYSU DS0753]